MRTSAILLLILFCGCGKKDLCGRFFEPYPDFISQRERTVLNGGLLDAMQAYDRKDYVTAAQGLERVIDADYSDQAARMYLVCALLASGDPYKAEMHLDFLERTHDVSFRDQVDWYDALCWTCSGQNERALKQARWIASRPRHAYKEKAVDLAEALDPQ